MCDTLGVVLDGFALFGKNSDRSPNEPQVTEFYPARVCGESSLRATYRSVPQAKETRAVLLSRPSWMWGAEIGVNDAGVAIGNEAVFTKGRYGEPALTGMDLLRLALERAESAESAVRIIVELLETYGQGGNCGFDHTFFYDNSFLILDRGVLYVLETCARSWVVKSYPAASISNRLGIGADGDRYGGGRCDFRRVHTDPLYTHFSGSKRRQACTERALADIQGVGDVCAALRTHDDAVENPFSQGTVSSCCMHYGGMVGDQSTASMVVSLGGGAPIVSLTGASLPCVSLYKPYRFGNPARPPVFRPDDEAGEAYWRAAERYRRSLLGKQLPPAFYEERDALETGWLSDVSDDAGAMDELLLRARREEAAFYARFDPEKLPDRPVKAGFRRVWAKKNAAFAAADNTPK